MSKKHLERLHSAAQYFRLAGCWVMAEIFVQMIEKEKKIVRFSYSKDAEKDGGRMTEKSGPNT